MFRHITLVAVAALTAISGPSAARVEAQDQLLRFTGLKGKIVAVSGDLIRWTDATNAEMYVQVNNTTKTKVTGTVEPSFLAPGLFVRFNADVSNRGKVLNDIDELTIFTPGDGFTTGVFEDGVVDPKAASAKYFIAGQIDSIKNGLLTIDTGEDSFKTKLADSAKLKIDVPDVSVARPDDEITFTGNGEAKNQIVATEIEIQLATPLVGVEKKAKRPAKSRQPARGNSPARPSINDVDVPQDEVPQDFE